MSETIERAAKIKESIPVIQYVIDSLRAAQRYNASDSVPPAAILWPDSDGQWKPIIDVLKTMLPEIVTLGEYAPELKTGPAIWIRCIVDGCIKVEAASSRFLKSDGCFGDGCLKVEAASSRSLKSKLNAVNVENAVPIVYMPNVSRQTLRAIEDCPEEIKPLVELQYRGITWLQKNGKDWTVEAFLTSEDGGLGLDVARDKLTRQAMHNALQELATTPLAKLRGKRLEAEDFDNLMVEDTPRELLSWMNNPESTREQWPADKWTAFCSQCRSNYGLDPESDGTIVAGEKLGRQEDAWSAVWQRYAESPSLYTNIPDLLRSAKPPELLFVKEPWPDENDALEDALRDALLKIGKLNAADARARIRELEKEHSERRNWVWARVGNAPLAQALLHLYSLVNYAEHPIAGEDLDSLIAAYCKSGYLADSAVLNAVSSVKRTTDIEAITAAIKSVYGPWLDDTCRNFQAALKNELNKGNISPKSQSGFQPHCSYEKCVEAESGECLLFIDGLRYDVAVRLIAKLKDDSRTTELKQRLAALPTVTSTAKSALSPIAEKLKGIPNSPDFAPSIKGGATLTADRFRKMLEEEGYQVIDSSETAGPHSNESRGWSEYGEFDSLGHKLQHKMVSRVEEQLELIADRVHSLLDTGWRSVRIVTDHGWLLLPGGLPVVKLPKCLTESRWARCALVKDTGHVDVPTAPWHWNAENEIAFAPASSCFLKGNEYAHGGLSLQEMVTPDIRIVSTATVKVSAPAIEDVQWMGLRCRLSTKGGTGAFHADIRTRVMDAESSVLVGRERRVIDLEGRAGLLVEDDSLIGTAAVIVILDSAGNVIAKQSTTIGGDE